MGYYDKHEQKGYSKPGRKVFPAECSKSEEPFGNQGPYRGFLLIKCEHCGSIKAFCTKRELYSYRCDECGEVTLLENLRPMYQKCKCGKEFRYKTNLAEEAFSHKCIECGAPVDLVLNKRKTAYVTVREKR